MISEKYDYSKYKTHFKLSCPYCGLSFQQHDKVKVCPDCGVVYHVSCWKRNKGCSTPNCPSKVIAFDEAAKSPMARIESRHQGKDGQWWTRNEEKLLELSQTENRHKRPSPKTIIFISTFAAVVLMALLTAVAVNSAMKKKALERSLLGRWHYSLDPYLVCNFTYDVVECYMITPKGNNVIFKSEYYVANGETITVDGRKLKVKRDADRIEFTPELAEVDLSYWMRG
jgi:hypothetical protein